MARIRIVEEWLRCPGAPPTRWRSIMAVAEQWAEQRVLMRAYAESVDQTRPTIVLHGVELAIGPAGTDAHGPWGIHVHPQVDGRAQEIAEALRSAARRLAGSKGNPARLADEQPDFDRKRTDNWSPGTPRALPGMTPSGQYYEPMVAVSQHAAPATYVPAQPYPEYVPATGVPVTPALVPCPSADSGDRMTPLSVPATPTQDISPPRRRRGWTSPITALGTEPGARTALGYESGAGAQSAIVRLGLRPAVAARLGRIGHRTVPADFAIERAEREVLNALGEHGELSARAIGQLVGSADPVAWMDRLITKLGAYGLDIVAPGQAFGTEPSYRLQP